MANFEHRTNIQNVEATTSQIQMKDNFKTMLNNVSNMLDNDGPIYTTWIKFQLGHNDKNALVFDSSSTDPNKNLIAQLNFEKNGAGITNSFTITIQYDPFNMGKDNTDTIEKLDDYVAKALSAEINDDSNALTGYLQYGYNSVSDASLVSPRYSFILTDASTEVLFESGLSTYTFSGVSLLSSDCDNVTKFSAINNWKLMDIIEWTLYYWYGTSEFKPKHTGSGQPTDNPYKYKIDIPDELYNDSPENISVPAQSGITPWLYCQHLLDEHNMTKSEIDSGIYTNVSKISNALTPRYIMYLDDSTKTIRITHIVPKTTNTDKDNNITGIDYSEKSLLSLDYTFYWGQQSQNLVLGWRPEASTKLYLIRKARVLRAEDELKKQELLDDTSQIAQDTKKVLDSKLKDVRDDLNEIFDAQLKIVGIPADIPLGVELGVMPTILQSVSRTAGIYIVLGSEDQISSNGIYTTTLKLLRIRDFNAKVMDLKSSQLNVNRQAQIDNKLAK